MTDQDQHTLRVLAAEDNDLNQLVLEQMLEPLAPHVTFVKNGIEAIAAWETGSFHLILMDVQMPIMDGTTAMREIRRREQEAGRAPIPIVALTANVMAHQIREYDAAGADYHIAKPIIEEEFLEIVRKAVANASSPGTDRSTQS